MLKPAESSQSHSLDGVAVRILDFAAMRLIIPMLLGVFLTCVECQAQEVPRPATAPSGLSESFQRVSPSIVLVEYGSGVYGSGVVVAQDQGRTYIVASCPPAMAFAPPGAPACSLAHPRVVTAAGEPALQSAQSVYPLSRNFEVYAVQGTIGTPAALEEGDGPYSSLGMAGFERAAGTGPASMHLGVSETNLGSRGTDPGTQDILDFRGPDTFGNGGADVFEASSGALVAITEAIAPLDPPGDYESVSSTGIAAWLAPLHLPLKLVSSEPGSQDRREQQSGATVCLQSNIAVTHVWEQDKTKQYLLAAGSATAIGTKGTLTYLISLFEPNARDTRSADDQVQTFQGHLIGALRQGESGPPHPISVVAYDSASHLILYAMDGENLPPVSIADRVVAPSYVDGLYVGELKSDLEPCADQPWIVQHGVVTAALDSGDVDHNAGQHGFYPGAPVYYEDTATLVGLTEAGLPDNTTQYRAVGAATIARFLHEKGVDFQTGSSPALPRGYLLAENAIVRVDGSEAGSGAAIATIDGDAVVLTARHVVRGKGARVYVHGSSEPVAARTLAYDDANDLALLRVPGLHVSALVLASGAMPGKTIVTAGYPVTSDVATWNSPPLQINRGIVSFLDGTTLAHTAASDPGESGGPIIDPETGCLYGTMLGAVTNATNAFGNEAFHTYSAASLQAVRPLLERVSGLQLGKGTCSS